MNNLSVPDPCFGSFGVHIRLEDGAPLLAKRDMTQSPSPNYG